jgi:hypothetical protein
MLKQTEGLDDLAEQIAAQSHVSPAVQLARIQGRLRGYIVLWAGREVKKDEMLEDLQGLLE